MVEEGRSSRSSSVRSRGNVRKQSKSRSSSAMAQTKPQSGNTRNEQQQRGESSTRPGGNVYQQAVYVAPSANPEVVGQAAVEVMQSRAQADLVAQQAVEALLQRDAANAQLKKRSNNHDQRNRETSLKSHHERTVGSPET